jgi:hypothetical protein
VRLKQVADRRHHPLRLAHYDVESDAGPVLCPLIVAGKERVLGIESDRAYSFAHREGLADDALPPRFLATIAATNMVERDSSLIETRNYFADVLTKLVNLWPVSGLSELMPSSGRPRNPKITT